METGIRLLGADQMDLFEELILLFATVFEMESLDMPPDEYLHDLLRADNFFAFAALHNNKVTGGLTAYTLKQYYSTSPLMYIYDLAVHPGFQCMGVGRMLIEELKRFSKTIDAEFIMVEAEETATCP